MTITKCLDRGEIEVTRDPQTTLEACDLASGVAICMYDPANRIAGLAHTLLPAHTGAGAGGGHGDPPSGYFADVGTATLVDLMAENGAQISMCEVVIVGGATFMAAEGAAGFEPLGARNVRAATEALRAKGVGVMRYCVGGYVNRAVSVDAATGEVAVR